jgi:hypothetical protein
VEEAVMVSVRCYHTIYMKKCHDSVFITLLTHAITETEKEKGIPNKQF